jgi:hypothetical protein
MSERSKRINVKRAVSLRSSDLFIGTPPEAAAT